MKLNDIYEGLKINFLTAIKYDTIKNRRHYWIFKCDCGKNKSMRLDRVLNGESKSCGCGLNIYKKHGFYKTRFYTIWKGMKNRGSNPNRKDANKYFLKGITVCDEWKNFEKFKEDMYGGYIKKSNEFGEKNVSIDRIDNDKGYYKENCRWATNSEQSNNISTNVKLTFNKKTLTISEWSKELKISRDKIDKRLKRGWSIEKTLTEK